MTEPRHEAVPAHALPASRSDRPWRLVLLVLALGMIAAVVASLVGLAALGRADRSSYSPISGTQELGRPAALTVTSDLGNITVRTSDEVDQARLRFIGPDGAVLEAPRARIARHGGSGGPDAGGPENLVVDVTGPGLGLSLPWDEPVADLELLVPSDLAASMPLRISADVGDATVEDGAYADLTVSSDVGDVTIAGASATGHVTATASVGDVELSLAPEASPTRIEARSETGAVAVSVPGTRRYAVTATTDVGDTTTAPGIHDPQGPPLNAHSEVGSVSVAR